MEGLPIQNKSKQIKHVLEEKRQEIFVDDLLLAKTILQDKTGRLFDKEIVQKFKDKIEMICRRYMRSETDFKEAIQISHINIYQGLHAFEARSTLVNWVAHIVKMTCFKIFKVQKTNKYQNNSPSTFSEDDIERYRGSHDEEHTLESEKLVFVDLLLEGDGKLLEAIIPGVRMRTIVLKYLKEGMKHREIAQELGITEGDERSAFNRGVKHIRKYFQENDWSEFDLSTD